MNKIIISFLIVLFVTFADCSLKVKIGAKNFHCQKCEQVNDENEVISEDQHEASSKKEYGGLYVLKEARLNNETVALQFDLFLDYIADEEILFLAKGNSSMYGLIVRTGEDTKGNAYELKNVAKTNNEGYYTESDKLMFEVMENFKRIQFKRRLENDFEKNPVYMYWTTIETPKGKFVFDKKSNFLLA